MKNIQKNPGERGAALAAVLISAVVFSIAAFAVLAMALSQTQTAGYYANRLRARYAAEAGMVWAMQRLWVNPNQTFPSGDTDLTVNGLAVDVVMLPCQDTPCEARALQAKVKY